MWIALFRRSSASLVNRSPATDSDRTHVRRPRRSFRENRAGRALQAATGGVPGNAPRGWKSVAPHPDRSFESLCDSKPSYPKSRPQFSCRRGCTSRGCTAPTPTARVERGRPREAGCVCGGAGAYAHTLAAPSRSWHGGACRRMRGSARRRPTPGAAIGDPAHRSGGGMRDRISYTLLFRYGVMPAWWAASPTRLLVTCS